MALARTNQIAEISTNGFGTGAFTTSAFTPPNNSLLVVCGVGMVNGTPSADPSGSFTMTGGGWTYTSRVSTGTNIGLDEFDVGIVIWTAPVTTGASMTLQIDAGATNMNFFAIAAVAYTGYDTSSPVGGTGSHIAGDGNPGSGDGAQSFTLSATPATTSEVFAGLIIDHEGIGTTPGSDFTEIYELQVGGSGGLQAQIRTNSASTTVGWVDVHTGTGSTYKNAGAAIEIEADTGLGTTYQRSFLQAAAPVPRVFRTGIRVPLQLMGDRSSVAAENATVTATAIATTSDIPAPTVQTGSTVAAAVIATTTGAPAPTVQTGSAVAATAIVTTTAMPAPTVIAATIVAPPVITTTTAMPAPAVQTGSTVAATAVVTTTAMPAPTIIAQTVVAPPAIVTTTAMPAPTIQTGSTVAATTVTTTTAAPAPTVLASAAADQNQFVPSLAPMFWDLGRSTQLLGSSQVAVSGDATVTPPVVSTVSAVPAPALQTGSTVSATTVTTVSDVPAPAVQTAVAADSNQAGPQLAWMFVAPNGASFQLRGDAQPAVNPNATVPATAIATVTALPAPTVQTGSTFTPPTIATVTTLPAPAVSTGSNATIAPPTIVTQTAMPAPSLQTGSLVNPPVIATVTVLPAPAIVAQTVVSPPAIATVTALPAPTVKTGSTVVATTVATVIELPVPTIHGTASGIQGNVYPITTRTVTGSGYPSSSGNIIGQVG